MPVRAIYAEQMPRDKQGGQNYAFLSQNAKYPLSFFLSYTGVRK